MTTSKYEISISYFLSSEDEENEELARELADTWYSMSNCVDADWYDDGEDFCVDIVFNLECEGDETFKEIDNALCKYLDKKGLDNFTWDYHYIKGTDNGFYWQP